MFASYRASVLMSVKRHAKITVGQGEERHQHREGEQERVAEAEHDVRQRRDADDHEDPEGLAPPEPDRQRREEDRTHLQPAGGVGHTRSR